MLALTWAQLNADDASSTGKISGVIQDQDSQVPIEYATVAVYSASDSSLVTGTITDTEGIFDLAKLAHGDYYVVVNYLGYEEHTVDNLQIDRRNSHVDVGEIFLESSAHMLEEVTLVNERNPIEFQIDKKVISVSDQMTSASLSAVEVLENVPSIRVDIEGNVSLRGSTGFTVLVDGKPTVLDPSDVLRQTPASTIENIEIITNPSSRYQPDGTGGIINIITKKNRMLGLQGLFNAKVGTFRSYGGDFLLNYRLNKINLYLGGDYQTGLQPGDSFSERRTTQDGTTTVIQADGQSESRREGGGLRMGLDWDLSPADNLTLGLRLGSYGRFSSSSLDYYTFQDPASFEQREISLNDGGRSGDYLNMNATYTRSFAREGQELMLQFNHSLRQSEEFSENFLLSEADEINEGTRSTEDGPSHRTEIKVDYTQPLGENHGLETGFQWRSGTSTDITAFYNYDLDSEDFVLAPDRSNSTDYFRDIYALYGILKGERGHFGYQAGIRGEYTFRDVQMDEQTETYTIQRMDFYPTLHSSYKISEKDQVMASYSRRIDRPRSWYLEPFLTWMDMYNVRSGNPALEPEYIDALEVGYIHAREKSQFSLEAYYRIKQNKVERVQEVYSEGVLLHTFQNVGTDYSLGMEALYNISIARWWELNFMVDLYDYRIDSEQNGIPYRYNSFNWGTRMNNTFRITEFVRLQLDGNYNSATITTQGRDEGYYAFNAAIRGDLFDRKLSLVLQARDVFGTVERVSVNQDVDFYNYTYRKSRAPVISLTASFRLNNFRQDRNAGGGMGDEF